jgi:hypothetical protein
MKHLKIFEEFTPGIENIFHKFSYVHKGCGKGMIWNPINNSCQSKLDFIHKLTIALKEANETDYWINLLFNSGYMERENYYAISADINEILRLLTSIIKTSKQNR